MIRAWLLLVLMALLSACSHSLPKAPQLRALLSPADLGYSIAVQQLIRFQLANDSQQMLVQLTVTPERLELFAFDGFSTPLFKLDYDGEKLNQKSFVPQLDESMAQFILADIQLVYWPLERLNQQLSKQSLEVKEQVCESALRCRMLYQQQRVVSEVKYRGSQLWQDEVSLKNQLANYQIDIVSLEVQ